MTGFMRGMSGRLTSTCPCQTFALVRTLKDELYPRKSDPTQTVKKDHMTIVLWGGRIKNTVKVDGRLGGGLDGNLRIGSKNDKREILGEPVKVIWLWT